jgi:hypothetical protein
MGLMSSSLLFAPPARLDPAYFSIIVSSQFTAHLHSANKAYVYIHACFLESLLAMY